MSEIQHLATPFSYSSAVVAGDYAFIALHRGFGDDFETQCKGALDGIRQTLQRIEVPLSSLVKVTVWIKHIQDLPVMEKLFTEYFELGQYPARMTATTEFYDPDCLVMVEGIAFCRS